MQDRDFLEVNSSSPMIRKPSIQGMLYLATEMGWDSPRKKIQFHFLFDVFNLREIGIL
jgi:hypothetical protein